jgi:hypothetical protein
MRQKYKTKRTYKKTKHYKKTIRTHRKNYVGHGPKRTTKRMDRRKKTNQTNQTNQTKHSNNSIHKINKKMINNFEKLLKNPDERKGSFLKAICNESNGYNCVNIGVYSELLKEYFNNYSIFTSYPNEIQMIGKPSVNGFLFSIKYTKNEYNSYTAMKCNKSNNSDNLLYEYYVGIKFINKFVPIFPCFIETYDQLYLYTNKTSYENIKSLSSIKTVQPFTNDMRNSFIELDKNDVDVLINPLSEMTNNSCKYGKDNKLAIMLQYYQNIQTFGSIIADFYNIHNPDAHDIPNIMFQVYFVLNNMRDIYTHYDLHGNNVLVYKPFKDENKYILMTYHLNDGNKMVFPTNLIAKIIDYGRNYFNDVDRKISSKNIIENFCVKCENGSCINPDCYQHSSNETIDLTENKPKIHNNFYCGEESGVRLGEYNKQSGSLHYLTPYKSNISHDLRLAKEIQHHIVQHGYTVKYDMTHGTPAVTNNVNPKRITNVTDMYNFLLDQNESYNQFHMPSKYDSTWVKMADLHIYEDRRPYEYIVSTN